MSVDFDVVDALEGFAEDLHGEGDFAMRLHDAVKRLKEERDEARAELLSATQQLELEREASAQLRAELGERMVETAERQREACAATVEREGHTLGMDKRLLRKFGILVRATPLVTDAKADGGAP